MARDRVLDKLWDRQLEEGLPDCRLRVPKTVVRAHMLWEEVFCGNCGKSGGLVTADWSPHVFFVCDDCATKLGDPPGAVQVADESSMRPAGN